ncbi:MAG: hypothetical protein JXR56_06690, partial [Candidatus Cloacimonetes bacterium]|nr:hypothetical protein [Candidatus Cloacimonadota bacterium]
MKLKHVLETKEQPHRNSFLNFILYYSLIYSILTLIRWTGLLSFMPEELLAGMKYFKGDFFISSVLFEAIWIVGIISIMYWKRWGFWILLLIAVLQIVIQGIFSR